MQKGVVINVHRIVYENVRLIVGQAFQLTSENIQGPVSLIRNSRDGGLHHLEMSALTFRQHSLNRQSYLSRRWQNYKSVVHATSTDNKRSTEE
ncbi:MAG: hypothetical protein J0665_17330 [Deltaproteobacteria bacterium]|nr:hypothetical protein [Deltaproteobacteria bacterium]